MEANNNQYNQSSQFRVRWRQSINQLSKLEQETNLIVLDTVHKKISTMKLKMKNRLGQIDDSFSPVINNKPTSKYINNQSKKQKIASTNHDTNVLTLGSEGTMLNLQQSIIILNPETGSQQNDRNLVYKCHQIREQQLEELTQYNKSKYQKQMQQQCSKYCESLKSKFYSIFDHPKKQLYEFCYMCDQILMTDQKQSESHTCKKPLDSISRVQQALFRIKSYVQERNNKIFNIFLHNAIQTHIDIDELVTNVRVLKQSLQHNYEPEDAVLRLRLMNLIGKKIGLLLEQKDLDARLFSLYKSKK